MKQNTKISRKKRVFIDVEYINQKDLKRSLDKLFLLISEGKERHEEIHFYQTCEILNYFKQWYVFNHREIKEVKESGQVIQIVKSKV